MMQQACLLVFLLVPFLLHAVWWRNTYAVSSLCEPLPEGPAAAACGLV